MLSSRNASVTIGGNVPGTNIIDNSRPYTLRFVVWKYSDENFSFIELSTAVNLRNLVNAYYSKVGQIGKTFAGDVAGLGDPVEGAQQRLTYARYWGNQLITQFADLDVFYQGKLIANIDQNFRAIVHIDFNLQIRWRDLENPTRPIGQKPPLNTHWVGAFPSYMDSEGTGYILLDRDNNLDGPIQNVNLTLREDENFVKSQVEFTNIPLFSKTLFVRPKLVRLKEEKICKKCKHHHKRCCKKKKVCQTSTDLLEYMVNYIFQNAKDVLDGFIEPVTGETNIRGIVKDYDKYRVEGTNMAFSYLNNQDGIMINMCARYNLESQNDCVVAFNMCQANNEIIMKVSNVPVDEDMRDVIYPFIIPFGYQLSGN